MAEVVDGVASQRRRALVAGGAPRQPDGRVGDGGGRGTAGRRREGVGARRAAEDDGAAGRHVDAEAGRARPRHARLAGRPARVVGRVRPTQVCSVTHTHTHTPFRLVWRRGAVVSGVRRTNAVNAHRARLVPGRVTVFGRVYHLGM